jgi:chemotaxis protein histidine kinase CheA
MHAADDQNYWPGYLDALINVMLTLLFMVGIFAIGMMLLNLQASKQRDEVEFMAEHAKKVIESLEVDQASREALLAKVQAMDMRAMISDAKELERLRQRGQAADQQAHMRPAPASQVDQSPVKVAAVQPNPAAAGDFFPAPAAVVSLPAAPPPDAVSTDSAVQASIAERKQQLEKLNQQILQLQGQLAREQAQLASRQSLPAVAAERWVDLRVGARFPAAADDAPAEAVRKMVAARTDLRFRAVWEFTPGGLAWPEDRAAPLDLGEIKRSGKWLLVGFIDPRNARVQREVFARLNAVREQLVDKGLARDRIVLDLRVAGDLSSLDDALYRLVFMLPAQ